MGKVQKNKGKEFESVYEWIDAVELSRKRKNFARDFSDGCLAAEVIKHYAGDKFSVDMHNYSEALSGPRKRDNWNLLNDKVLKKHLGVRLDKAWIEEICSVAEGAAERLLMDVKAKFDAGASPPPVKRQPAPAPVLPEHPKDGRDKVQAVPGARRQALPFVPLKVAARAGNAKRDPSPAPGGAHKASNDHLNRPAQRPSPHPPQRGSDGKVGKAGGISPSAAGGRGRGPQRASSASKAASPKRAAPPGPAGRGRESNEWWGESSQNASTFHDYAPSGRAGGGRGGGGGGERGVGGGALDSLIELAQGDLNQFDMQLQMHLMQQGRERAEDLVLPPVKNAQKKAKAPEREHSLSPSKLRTSKESPLKLLPERASPRKKPGEAAGGRDVSLSPAKARAGGQVRGQAKEVVGNKAKRQGRREAWAELEREGGLPEEQGPDLVQECDEALDGLRHAHTSLEAAIQKLEAKARDAAAADRLPNVRELGVMVGAANHRMARKAKPQGMAGGGAGGVGWQGDGQWGSHDIDLYTDLGPHYRAAEEDLPLGHLRRMPEMDLIGLQAVGGGGPAGIMGMGAGWGEHRKMHGELQNYPWFNPYLPSVSPHPQELAAGYGAAHQKNE